MSSTIDYCSDDGEADALYSSKIKLAEAKKEIDKLKAENARLRQAIVTVTSKLETQRIWNGTDWHYNSLPPLYYKPALEVLINALR